MQMVRFQPFLRSTRILQLTVDVWGGENGDVGEGRAEPEGEEDPVVGGESHANAEAHQEERGDHDGVTPADPVIEWIIDVSFAPCCDLIRCLTKTLSVVFEISLVWYDPCDDCAEEDAEHEEDLAHGHHGLLVAYEVELWMGLRISGFLSITKEPY